MALRRKRKADRYSECCLSDNCVVVTSGQQIERLLQQTGLLGTNTGVAVACLSPRTGVLTWTCGSLGSGTALDPSTPMYAASVTKQLIGVLVAQQVLAARLHSDDRVIELLPTLPGWAESIRVRHLLHHTSGLPTAARVLAAVGLDDEQHLTNSLVLHGLASLYAPEAPAGSTFAYSNIGYIVLAEILRALTGTALPVLAQESLFAPLGMTASFLTSDEQPTLPLVTKTPRTIGDGGWWTSASDLLIWLDALNCDHLGPDLTQLVQTPGYLDDGSALDYAWGITARPTARGTNYTHGGNVPGWSAKTVRRPATRTAVALLTVSNDVQGVSQAGFDLHESLPVHLT